MDDYLANALANIDKFGVHLTAVASTADDPDPEPPFTYTAGLTVHDHPELIIFGLPSNIAGRLLNTLAFSVIHDHATYAHGDTIHHLVNGYPVRLVAVTDTTEHLSVANAIYAIDAPVTALQLAYPDKDGRWPWEPGSGVAALPTLGPIPSDDEGRQITLPD